MDTQLLLTIIYSFLFCCIFYYLYISKVSNSVLYIVGIWVVSSIFAVIFQILYVGHYTDLSIWPYLYIILCFLITLKPLVKEGKILRDNIPILVSPIWDYLMYGFIIISIVPFIENLHHVLVSYGGSDTSSLADIYDDKMYGTGVQLDWLSSIGKLGNSIDGLFINFLVFTPFYFLLRPKINKVLLYGSFLPLANHILFQLATSGRGFATQVVLLAVFFYFTFKDKLSRVRTRFIKIVGMCLIVAFAFAMSILTIARRDSTNNGVETSIALGYYVAKSHLDFNQELWHMKKHTEGDNSFGFVKKMMGFRVPADKNEYWSYAKTGIIPSLFYTYVGDWYMDFGAIIAFILFCLFAKVFGYMFARSRLPKKSIIPLFCYYIYSSIIINGWTINIYKTQGAFRNLLVSFVLIILINFTTKERRYNGKLKS